jgi:hypothetical protein
MSKHVWRQKAFTDGGTYLGITTCLNIWGCKTCNEEIEIPLGMNPDQYYNEPCKGGQNVYRTDPNKMPSLPKYARLRS